MSEFALQKPEAAQDEEVGIRKKHPLGLLDRVFCLEGQETLWRPQSQFLRR
jgi:hypothetical protein